MKFNLSRVMKAAWSMKKRNPDNIFSICLKMAWRNEKEIVLQEKRSSKNLKGAMTDRQRWFIDKLMREIEELGYVFSHTETAYASCEYNSYRMTKQDASNDIETLLALKASLA